MSDKTRGPITVRAAETLAGYYSTMGYHIFYDHDSTKENTGKIVSWFGEKHNRESELSHLDIAIVKNGSDRAVALLEIEETTDTPKTLMGDLFGILLGDHISFRGEKDFSVGQNTTLIIIGKSTVAHRKQNKYLREQAMKIKSGLSTANSAIGDILVDTFADEKGLHALLSKLLDGVLIINRE